MKDFEFIGLAEGQNGQAMVIIKENTKLKVITYEEYERLK